MCYSEAVNKDVIFECDCLLQRIANNIEEIPECKASGGMTGETAHQAVDKRYYRRHKLLAIRYYQGEISKRTNWLPDMSLFCIWGDDGGETIYGLPYRRAFGRGLSATAH